MTFSSPSRRTLRPLALAASLLALLLFLGGCAAFSPDGGFSSVQTLTKERTGQDITRIQSDNDAATVANTIAPLLTQALSVDDAVKIALLNNRGLQAAYAELAISEADLVQAGRIQNPSFSFGRLRRGGEVELDRSLMLPIMSLLTMPITSKIERHRFERAQLRAAGNALAVVDATRRAYFSTVAAQESVKYMTQVKLAAQAGAELGQKMATAGNWSKLDQAREQTFYSDATTQLAHAEQTHIAEREKLTRLLSLSGTQTAFLLPDRLPDLPTQLDDIEDVEMQAMQNRLDIMMNKRDLSSIANSFNLSKTTRFINILDLRSRLEIISS